ncbi:chromodomain-helicase-DNA-binding protein 8 isoform X2 [Latimeria chalumnae]|uniref:chromodomain-helicase-DNA-binding protein 8 isoform X2 n=1 Tax=Latimeria chalumnae TaxID=7897 RepID=UPI0003C12FDB|nr:PREDICTED: chromodomain-helicase-DNA-binding protein 8 isoform X2 [Latimeria chalumnae]|eukprot:XP_006005388.1 PREDICTED: chromodomain-helicase-DNA-binding protein 8 isoform X2 [Latimeria chalumnae]
MADPIMDLFDDPNLFGLDSLTEETFGQDGPDPIEDALCLPGGLEPLDHVTPTIGNTVAPQTTPSQQELVSATVMQPQNAGSLTLHDYISQQSATPSLSTPQNPDTIGQPSKGQEALSQGNPFMGVTTVTSTAPPSVKPQPKIIIVKTQASGSMGSASQGVLQPVTSILGPGQTVGQVAANGGKVSIAKVLTGTPLRPGVSIVSGNAVLATKVAGGGQPMAGVQRIVQQNGPVKQLILQPVTTQQAQGTTVTSSSGSPLKPGITVTSASPAQGEPKRITLVLQQPQMGGQPGQRHVLLGNLPGKIFLQGNQLAALTQAKNAQGQPAKVVTIQLQVQQPQQQKIQLVQQALGQGQFQPGQRLAVPLKVLLQPQAGSSQGSTSGLSVVKVLNACEVAAVGGATSHGELGETRKMEHQKKQEKANRIVAEAIARAKARGEQNIPRVLNEDELPTVRPDGEADKKKKKKTGGGGAMGERLKEEKPKKLKTGGCSKSKSKSKPNTITPVVGKKRKRNPSSDNSDAELTPPVSPKEDEETTQRRSNRQVKRKKYTEDLDIKITDDEEEEVDVTGPVKPEPIPEPVPEPDVEENVPSMQFFVENPSEEDAAIVDKILSVRLSKKELSPGHYMDVEEFFVKYKNYSYLHCEWATIQQLERDKRIHQKIKRFKTKMAQMRLLFHEDEDPFNPDYVEVDRILDESHSIDKDNGEPVIYYLVKWCSLPYEDSTWELKEDVDEAKVAEFKRIQARKPEIKRVARPLSSVWKKLELSREYKNGNSLREYQLEGVNWLLFNWYNRQNCILADEMGLGKTIQSITFLQEVYSVGVRGPFLVIAPLSTITNWEREFCTWTDMNTIVYHGSLASRQMIQQYEMYCKDSRGRLIPGAYKFDALITTFEMVLSDCPELREIEWRCVIIDEAHRLKNRNCKLLDSLKHLDLEHKVLLTGTPLQNTVEELFSLLHFLDPSQFPSESEFLKDFGDLKTEEQVQKLQSILKPMMLRRLKEDVEKNLAPKQETIIEVELTNVQKKYYRAILEKNFTFLSKGAGQANMPNLLNTMMELRKCCNHPYLINGAEEKILAESRERYDPMAPDFHLQAMVRSAGKLVLIDKLLPKLKAGGHKVLIFSQMVRCLDILEDYLIQKRYQFERIDGRVRGNLRQAAIDRFSKPDSDRFVFLLCTRAGGLGINLTAADTCIIFDSDWNPQNDLQAQARCHRIGQSKAVKVYRLITRNSYEREMFDRASLKLGLDKAVLQSMSSGSKEGGVNGVQQFSKKEIEDLLRKGAYAAIMDEDDEGSKFCEEDIDQILQRRTTTITIESEGKGSTFAKASFVASENRTDIALDDPNFWQKWAKKADIDMDSLGSKNNLVLDTPRVRKQTRHFSTLKDDDMVDFTDMDSDEDDRPRSRRYDRHHGYGRTDCFRVEKHLLVYGWGRWKDILAHGRFKRRMLERDIETICRTILVYCLLHYKGDENIKGFIWDLISPAENGKTKELQNHSGLSIPVPRGRKGKKVKSQSTFDIHKADWIRKYNPDTLFTDDSYKKHLKHQCNKVLLRVRMLYYLRQEVIGDQAEKVMEGAEASEIDIWFPEMDQLEVPSDWWDSNSDKSLLIGVFKHGYEKYNTMRADPALCFLDRVGRPDEKAIAAEQRGTDNFGDLGEGLDFEKDSEDPEYRPIHGMGKDEEEVDMLMDEEISVVDGDEKYVPQPGARYWPPASALTARLRRLVTAFQRSYKREQMRIEAAEKGDRRRRRCEAAFKLKEIARREKQQRWTRREEADFYRVVSTFGVEFDPDAREFHWNRFRSFARLEKKTNESLTKYFQGFVAMCRRVCGLPPCEGEEYPDPMLFVEPITEERASRTLYRIDLLRRVREQVLRHPQLDERLQLSQPGPELPEWWECGRHDRELLLGVARHGVSRTDYAIMRDPEFSFLAAHIAYLQSRPVQSRCSTPLLHHQYASRTASPLTLRPDTTEKRPESVGVRLEDELAVKLEAEGLLVDQTVALPTVGEVASGALLGLSPHLKTSPTFLKKEGNSGEETDSDSELEKFSFSPSSSNPSSLSESSDDEKECKLNVAGMLPQSKLYDEESVLSLNASQDSFPNEDIEPTTLELLTERQRSSDWPKDRVLINRIDNLCQLVLTGKWPPSRRVHFEGMAAAAALGLPSGATRLMDSPLLSGEYGDSPVATPASFSLEDDTATAAAAAMAQFTKLRKSTDEKEFTVRIKEDEGIKLTIQKHKLLVNGALPMGYPLLKKKKRRKRSQQVDGERVGDSPMRGADLEPDSRIPVVSKVDGTVLVGEEAPSRAELDQWLRERPEYEVDPRFLAYLDDRQRRRRHRYKPQAQVDLNNLTGMERVQLVNTLTGRKLGGAIAPLLKDLKRCLEDNPHYVVSPKWGEAVKHSGFLPESMFDRILMGPDESEEIRKSISKRPKNSTLPNMAAQVQPNPLLAATDPNPFQAFHRTLPPAGMMGHANMATTLPIMQFGSPPGLDSRMFLHRGVGAPAETLEEVEVGAEDLTQDFESSDERDFSLMGDPMMPTHSDSSEDD